MSCRVYICNRSDITRLRNQVKGERAGPYCGQSKDNMTGNVRTEQFAFKASFEQKLAPDGTMDSPRF